MLAVLSYLVRGSQPQQGLHIQGNGEIGHIGGVVAIPDAPFLEADVRPRQKTLHGADEVQAVVARLKAEQIYCGQTFENGGAHPRRQNAPIFRARPGNVDEMAEGVITAPAQQVAQLARSQVQVIVLQHHQ